MRRAFFVTLLAAIVAFGFAGTAAADSLQVQGVGADPVQVGSTSAFSMLLNAGALTNLTLLFSVPNFGSPTVAPSLLTSSSGTIGSFSLAGNLAGSASCQGPGEVYSCAGLGTGGPNSNNLSNFNGFNASINGITGVKSYDIYKVVITNANLSTSPGGKPTIDFTGSFGVGTYIDGFAANTGSTGPNPLFSAFTDAGLITKTPEPASLLLLGLGLAGVPFFRRKR